MVCMDSEAFRKKISTFLICCVITLKVAPKHFSQERFLSEGKKWHRNSSHVIFSIEKLLKQEKEEKKHKLRTLLKHRGVVPFKNLPSETEEKNAFPV